MANKPRLSPEEMHKLALIGAEQRLEKLRNEINRIKNAFPELRGIRRKRTPSKPAGTRSSKSKKTARKKWSWNDDQKKAVSKRMKKYWADRRKEKTRKAKAKSTSKSVTEAKTE